MRPRINIKAVWDSDLEALLRNFGILEKLLAEEVNCKVCRRMVNLENLGTIVKDDKSIAVTCDDATCITKVAQPPEHTGVRR